MGLALLAHLLLGVALAWGVNWNRDSAEVSAEAELWSNTVQLAAPAPVETPPPPPPPEQALAPAPPPPRVTAAIPVAAPPAPQIKDADIALERDKERRRAKEEKAREALDKQKKDKAAREAAAREAADKKAAQKKAAELKAAELSQAEQKAAEKLAADKAAEAAEQAKRTREAEEGRLANQMREDQLKRIQGMAGATGGPAATGNATRSAGPSDSYAGRIEKAVRPNIRFTDVVPGNLAAEVEVTMALDGTILSSKIARSSGNKSWDEAVLRGLERTLVLPRDVDGRVHSPLLINFNSKPKGL